MVCFSVSATLDEITRHTVGCRLRLMHSYHTHTHTLYLHRGPHKPGPKGTQPILMALPMATSACAAATRAALRSALGGRCTGGGASASATCAAAAPPSSPPPSCVPPPPAAAAARRALRRAGLYSRLRTSFRARREEMGAPAAPPSPASSSPSASVAAPPASLPSPCIRRSHSRCPPGPFAPGASPTGRAIAFGVMPLKPGAVPSAPSTTL